MPLDKAFKIHDISVEGPTIVISSCTIRRTDKTKNGFSF